MARQSEIPGTEREVNKRIENVMEVLDSKRKAKTRAGVAHKEAELRVIEVMREEKVKSYTSVDLGLTVEIDETRHAKLSSYQPPEEEKRAPKAEA
jgi:hypothetical protein